VTAADRAEDGRRYVGTQEHGQTAAPAASDQKIAEILARLDWHAEQGISGTKAPRSLCTEAAAIIRRLSNLSPLQDEAAS
jgi:hypothetical protein